MPPRDTREEILKVASTLLQTRGFSAFSYGHIAETLEVKPAAIHYHFASKTDWPRAHRALSRPVSTLDGRG